MATEEGGTGKTDDTDTDFRKKIQQLEVENKMLKGRFQKAMKAHIARRHEIHEVFRQAQKVDLCFLVDCTGSMEPYIANVKDNIFAMIEEVWKTSRKLDIRLAFVGYRDFCDDDDRLTTLPFTKNVENFVKFVDKEKANGGGDGPEDVFGGLNAVLGLDWEADTRVLIHIADAPCHGSQFHVTGMEDRPSHCLDDEGKDKNGLSAEGLILRLIFAEISYYFNHVKRSNTQKMISEFNRIAEKSGYVISETDLEDTVAQLERSVVQSVTRSIADSVLILSKTPVMCWEEQDFPEIIGKVPDWSEINDELATATWYEPPSSIEDLRPGAVLHKRSASVFVKVASNPFAEGQMRRTFYARCVSGTSQMPRDIVVKKLRCGRDSSITACEDQMEIQCVAKYLAEVFNVKLTSTGGEWPKLEFLMAWSIQIANRDTPFYANLESFVTGDFEKFNNNAGYVSGCHDILQAFSHWTHHVTKGYLIVVDIQGVRTENRRSWRRLEHRNKYVLTDPAIHCTEIVRSIPRLHSQYGDTNLGEEGMKAFFATHRCNDVCRKLGLTDHEAAVNPSTD